MHAGNCSTNWDTSSEGSKEQRRTFPRDHCFSWFLYILGFKSSLKEILAANVSLENLDSLAMFQTQKTRHLSFILDTSHFKTPCLTLGFPSPVRRRKFESLQSVLLFSRSNLNLEILAYLFFKSSKLKLKPTNCYKLIINLKVLNIFYSNPYS